MKRNALLLALLLIVAVTASVQAQATRTWVSGVGDDVNPCSRTAPCKTFAGAISKTAAGGEISVLDPGGFGAVTITKSMTLNGTAQIASILHSSTNGVIINCSACNVTLRNIEINGAGVTPGLRGVWIISAREVHLDGVRIWNQRSAPGRGVDINTSAACDVFLDHTRIWNVSGQAVANVPSAGSPAVKITISDCIIEDNIGGSGDGLFLNGGATATVNRTTFAGFASAGVEANNSDVTLSDNTINNCTIGVFAGSGGTVRLNRNTISNNVTAGFNASAGVVQSFGDNYFTNNGANVGALTPASPAKQ
jgi:hypothetical protein